MLDASGHFILVTFRILLREVTLLDPLWFGEALDLTGAADPVG
jgi:hypothetical protein